MNFNFKFIQNKKIFFIISAAVVIIGLVSMIFRGFYWDVDFAGGTEITYKINTENFSAEKETSTIELQARDALSAIGSDSNKIKIAQASNNEVIIKSLELDEYEIAAIHAQLKSHYNDPVVSEYTLDEIKQLREAALSADSEEDEDTANDETADNEVVEDETVVDETADNEVVEDETVVDETVDNEAVEDETVEDETVDNEVVEDETVEDETADNEVVEGETVEDETADNEVVEDETVEDETADNEVVEDETVEGETADNEVVVREGLESVSGSVSADLRNAAIVSSIIAVVLMLVYITIRFQFSSALAAVICLCHDVFVVLAAYSILQIPVSSSVIAVTLTILGYSINATIIIFDRVRENVRLIRNATFAEKVNISINQTLMRSINTTVTTLLTIGLIYILGVQSIKEFSLPLIIGLIAGLYSSVCLSGALWTVFKRKNERVK